MSFNLRALLEEMIEKEASDLHITTGERPKLRVDGDIVGDTQGDFLHPIVLDLRDGLLVEMVVSEPELLQMGNVPVESRISGNIR